ATERGIRVCGPIHDALLIEAPEAEIDDAVAGTQRAMREASEIVLAGFPLRTDAKIVRYPDRHSDPRGAHFWRTVLELSDERTPPGNGPPTADSTPATDGAGPLPSAAPPSSIFFFLYRDTPHHAPGPDRPKALPIAGGDDGAAEAEAEAAAV